MKLLCFERDNTTQLSDPDSHGNMYTASFEFFPFHEGDSFSVYKGRMNGEGPLRGEFCAVKTFQETVGEASVWDPVLRRAKEAARLAAMFNTCLGYPAVAFTTPYLTQIETVSSFNTVFRCFKPHRKNLEKNEFVVIEKFLKGRFQTFGSFDSGAPFTDVYGTAGSSTCHVVQAFSHFTWHVTRNLLISDLQGVVQMNTRKDSKSGGMPYFKGGPNTRYDFFAGASEFPMYQFIAPVIHSLEGLFGHTDSSINGVADFFKNHQCNSLCSGWIKNGSYDASELPFDQGDNLMSPALQTLPVNAATTVQSPEGIAPSA